MVPKVHKMFENVFKDESLDDVLDCFDGRRRLDEVMTLFPDSLKEFGVDVVVWLLRSVLTTRTSCNCIEIKFGCVSDEI